MQWDTSAHCKLRQALFFWESNRTSELWRTKRGDFKYTEKTLSACGAVFDCYFEDTELTTLKPDQMQCMKWCARNNNAVVNSDFSSMEWNTRWTAERGVQAEKVARDRSSDTEFGSIRWRLSLYNGKEIDC